MKVFGWIVFIGIMYFSIVSFLNGCGSSGGNETRISVPVEMDERVLNELMLEANITTPTVIYRYPEPMKPGDVVERMAFSDTETSEEVTQEVIFTALNDTYFYYVDYYEDYLFGHSVEYLFIDSVTQEVTRVTGEFWPILNGEALFYTKKQIGNPAHILTRITPEHIELLDQLEWREYTEAIEEENSAILPFASLYGVRDEAETPTQTALVINGVHPEDGAREGSETAARQAKDNFEKYGYKGNVTVIDRKNFSGEDADRETADSILNFLNSYSAPSGSNLTIYIVSHGTTTSWLIGKKNKLLATSSSLLGALKKLHQQGIRVKLIAQPCYSAVFVGKLKKYLAVGVGAANYSPSLAIDIDKIYDKKGNLLAEDKNPNDEGPEFTSGYFEDYAQTQDRYRRDASFRAWLDALAAEKSIPVEELILISSFYSGLDKDLSAYVDPGGSKNYTPDGEPIKSNKPTIFIDGQNYKKLEEDKNGLYDWIRVMIGYISVDDYNNAHSSSSSQASSTPVSSSSSSSSSDNAVSYEPVHIELDLSELVLTHYYGSSSCPQFIGTVNLFNDSSNQAANISITGHYAVSISANSFSLNAGASRGVDIYFNCATSTSFTSTLTVQAVGAKDALVDSVQAGVNVEIVK